MNGCDAGDSGGGLGALRLVVCGRWWSALMERRYRLAVIDRRYRGGRE